MFYGRIGKSVNKIREDENSIAGESLPDKIRTVPLQYGRERRNKNDFRKSKLLERKTEKHHADIQLRACKAGNRGISKVRR